MAMSTKNMPKRRRGNRIFLLPIESSPGGLVEGRRRVHGPPVLLLHEPVEAPPLLLGEDRRDLPVVLVEQALLRCLYLEHIPLQPFGPLPLVGPGRIELPQFEPLPHRLIRKGPPLPYILSLYGPGLGLLRLGKVEPPFELVVGLLGGERGHHKEAEETDKKQKARHHDLYI